MNVRGPGGETWRVGRRWLPWRPRYRGPETSGLDIPLELGDVGGILALIAIVAAVFLLVAVALPVLALAVELIVLVLVVLGATALRLTRVRPWLIEARTDGPPRRVHAWHVKGWRASGEAIEHIAQACNPAASPASRRVRSRRRAATRRTRAAAW